MQKYKPLDSQQIPRFSEVKTFMRLPNIRTVKDVDFVVTGAPFDTACSYRTGSRFGPSAIRNASSLLKPYNRFMDVNIFDHLSGVDYGDLSIVPGYIESTYKRMQDDMTPIIEAGVVPIVLGGDHSITLAELRAVAAKHGPVALVHFDAHTDTYSSYFGEKYNHGTPFKYACDEGLIDTEHSIQVGMRGTFYSPDDLKISEDMGFKVLTTPDIREIGLEETGKMIRERVGNKPAFFTFDIDFVDPAYAPGTGTIEVGGFTSYETLQLIRMTKEIDFKGFDVVEVLPAHDNNEITAFLAANVAYEFISILANRVKNN
ncbi:MAG TPA: agmatinase [Spirochaeta sp.]|nr:agmatinase [Spirochaeta sp.]